MELAQRVFEEDVAGAAFQRGTALGKWRLAVSSWPHPIIAITAATRDNAPSEYFFRFDLAGYPARAPTSQIWDIDGDQSLPAAERPAGGPNVEIAFRTNWEPALYIPCDRVALESHSDWVTKAGAWKQGHDITHYLNYVHALLNSPSYAGTRSAIASA